MRHHALATRIVDDDGRLDPYLINVLTPCHGYLVDAMDNASDEGAPTCLWCVVSRFVYRVKAMNLDAIEHLGEDDLVTDLVDQDAMSLTYVHDT